MKKKGCKEIVSPENRLCWFEEHGGCLAIVCYSNEKCLGRDEDGNPNYYTEKEREKLFEARRQAE